MSGAKLLRRYNTELMSSAVVRQLMASVSQDAQNETISYKESMISVRKAAEQLGSDKVGQARRDIIGYLNDIAFASSPLPIEWWFEMHTRLQKVCVISMILEGDNLRSFGATPQPSDIPQALIYVFDTMVEKRKSFPMLVHAYAEKIHALRQNYNDYVVCYLEK